MSPAKLNINLFLYFYFNFLIRSPTLTEENKTKSLLDAMEVYCV